MKTLLNISTLTTTVGIGTEEGLDGFVLFK